MKCIRNIILSLIAIILAMAINIDYAAVSNEIESVETIGDNKIRVTLKEEEEDLDILLTQYGISEVFMEQYDIPIKNIEYESTENKRVLIVESRMDFLYGRIYQIKDSQSMSEGAFEGKSTNYNKIISIEAIDKNMLKITMEKNEECLGMLLDQWRITSLDVDKTRINVCSTRYENESNKKILLYKTYDVLKPGVKYQIERYRYPDTATFVGYGVAAKTLVFNGKYELERVFKDQNRFEIIEKEDAIVLTNMFGTSHITYDGVTWEKFEGQNMELEIALWNGKKYLAVGDDGEVYISADGFTWDYQEKSNLESIIKEKGIMYEMIHDVIWNGTKFIGCNAKVGNFFSSSDGIKWVNDGKPYGAKDRYDYRSFNTIASNGVITVAGGSYGRRAVLNKDGKWKDTSSNKAELSTEKNNDSSFKKIIWDGNQFIAIADVGGSFDEWKGGLVLTSEDGIVWKEVYFHKGLGLFTDLIKMDNSIFILGQGYEQISINEGIYRPTYVIETRDLISWEKTEITNNHLFRLVTLKDKIYLANSSGIYLLKEKPSEWAVTEVEKMDLLGLIDTDVIYGYDSIISREEFCGIVAKVYKMISQKNSFDFSDNVFIDTNDEEINLCCHLGLVNGIGNDLFAPKHALSREEAFTIIKRLIDVLGFKVEENDEYIEYDDNSEISDWAKETIIELTKMDIINGSNGKVSPKKLSTREEMYSLIYRMVERFKGMEKE